MATAALCIYTHNCFHIYTRRIRMEWNPWKKVFIQGAGVKAKISFPYQEKWNQAAVQLFWILVLAWQWLKILRAPKWHVKIINEVFLVISICHQNSYCSQQYFSTYQKLLLPVKITFYFQFHTLIFFFFPEYWTFPLQNSSYPKRKMRKMIGNKGSHKLSILTEWKSKAHVCKMFIGFQEITTNTVMKPMWVWHQSSCMTVMAMHKHFCHASLL